jgi:hypothetical protein
MTTTQLPPLEHFIELRNQGIAAVANSAEYKARLDFMTLMPNYSYGNICLLLAQKPDISLVASSKVWHQLGRHPKKDEHALRVLGPIRRWVDVTDPDTGQKSREYKIVSYKRVPTFDVSQTDGRPLPDFGPKVLAGDVPAAVYNAVIGLAHEAGWIVQEGPTGHAFGLAHPESNTITIRPGLEPLQGLKTLTHELAHVLHGHTDDMVAYVLHRGIKEIEAESTAYVVMASAGLDTSSYSFPYLVSWGGNDPRVLARTADSSVRVAQQIIDRLPLLRLRTAESEVAEVSQGLVML